MLRIKKIFICAARISDVYKRQILNRIQEMSNGIKMTRISAFSGKFQPLPEANKQHIMPRIFSSIAERYAEGVIKYFNVLFLSFFKR